MAIQKTNFKSLTDIFNENLKPLLIVLSCVVVMIFFFFIHHLWVVKREQAAQYDFAFLMTEYDVMSREKNPAWADLLEKFEKNYDKHSHSSLLSYYLGYKVRILLAQNKQEEALIVLDKMIENLSLSSPLLNLYKMERALIQLDNDDDALRSVGLEMLKDLASDAKNISRDSAQYYLGRYYWSENNFDQAREVWQTLVDEQRDEKIAPSAWLDYVRAQLDMIVIESE